MTDKNKILLADFLSQLPKEMDLNEAVKVAKAHQQDMEDLILWLNRVDYGQEKDYENCFFLNESISTEEILFRFKNREQ